jgi:hypothetical protein
LTRGATTVTEAALASVVGSLYSEPTGGEPDARLGRCGRGSSEYLDTIGR